VLRVGIILSAGVVAVLWQHSAPWQQQDQIYATFVGVIAATTWVDAYLARPDRRLSYAMAAAFVTICCVLLAVHIL
jgi:hypothetical protein